VDGMDPGPLKNKLMQCKEGPFHRTDFSIGHRGAALQFPEHTKEAYQAGARMGAGIVECDVTFTGDGGLVCRHAPDDLHTTTNILQTPLASTCATPFTPAQLDASGKVVTPASAMCRTSELTVDEFKSLRGKMDASNPAAQTVDQYVGGTPPFRTDLYTGRGTVMTFRESIELNEKMGVKHTPELKAGDPQTIARVFGGQDQYAQRFADELIGAGVDPRNVYAQSFNPNDILYWIKHTPFGKQAVFLIDYDDVKNNIILPNLTGDLLETREDQLAFLRELREANVRIVAPAMPALLAVNGDRVVPSQLAKDLNDMGFDIITWTFERADLRAGASKAGFYYDFDPTDAAIKKDSDMYKALDVLAKDVGILGIFSDWPATVTYYANCMGL
jgi:glycerophosphoryl diester phosphodiesterase